MRDIKFKIYDKELKESHIEKLQDLCEDDYWYDGETDVWSVLYDSHNEQERFVALQYTGLKDKNGTEIYEGDIVQDHFYEKKAKIIYMEAAFYLDYTFDFIQYETNHNRYQLISNYDTREALEVIGNIYDNPELIKEAKI